MKNLLFIIEFILKLPQRIFSKVSVLALLKKSVIHPTVSVKYGTRIYWCEIDRYTYINNNCWVIRAEIGSFCSISSNVMIGGGKHPLNYVSTSPVFYSEHNVLKRCFNKTAFDEYEKTVIGNDVWIGSNAFIKGGIKIGTGAVIGAYAVVTKDVEPYTIIVGNPAKMIKKRFDDEIINKLIDSKWWDLDESILKEKSAQFTDVAAFLSSFKKA